MPATIYSLATETLREIFLSAFLSQAVEEWCTRTLPALLLVSPRFRAIIESYPTLWTSLFVTEKSAHLPGQSHFLSTHKRLRRSGKHALSITIKLPRKPMPNVFARKEAEILGVILRNVASRVQSLEIRSESRVLQMAVLCQLGETPMPLLRSFTHVGSEDPAIGLLNDYLRPGYFELVRQYRPSILQDESDQMHVDREFLNEWGMDMYPVLENIEIAGARYCWHCLPIMHSIRRISLRGQPKRSKIFMKSLLTMLEPISGTLEVLELVDVMRQEPDDLDGVITFRSLESFSLGYDDVDIAYDFLPAICLPALKDLTLTHIYEGRDTCIPSESRDVCHLTILYLIQTAPLNQVERLTLNGVVFPNENIERVNIPRPGTESEATEDFLMDHFQLPGLVPIYGHWSMPLMVLFLFKFGSLRHLSLENLVCSDGKENLMKMLGRYWQQGAWSTLETLHLDGPSEGVLDVLSAVEKDKKSGFRSLPLQISVGGTAVSALSEAEKSELYYYVNALETV